jgi:hypothetical protein
MNNKKLRVKGEFTTTVDLSLVIYDNEKFLSMFTDNKYDSNQLLVLNRRHEKSRNSKNKKEEIDNRLKGCFILDNNKTFKRRILKDKKDFSLKDNVLVKNVKKLFNNILGVK